MQTPEYRSQVIKLAFEFQKESSSRETLNSNTESHLHAQQSRIEHDFTELAATPRNSLESPENHARAVEWITAEFNRIGLAVSTTIVQHSGHKLSSDQAQTSSVR